jgi:hypothetical protein
VTEPHCHERDDEKSFIQLTSRRLEAERIKKIEDEEQRRKDLERQKQDDLVSLTRGIPTKGEGLVSLTSSER